MRRKRQRCRGAGRCQYLNIHWNRSAFQTGKTVANWYSGCVRSLSTKELGTIIWPSFQNTAVLEQSGFFFMARVGIIFGLMLCGLTVLGLIASPGKVPSQFLPMMFGIPIFFCGIVGLNPHRLRHSMHGAASVGLIGLVIGACLAVYTGIRLPDGQDLNAYVFRIVTVMSILCFAFVATCITSFVNARARKSA